jgi:hypothetical protein
LSSRDPEKQKPTALERAAEPPHASTSRGPQHHERPSSAFSTYLTTRAIGLVSLAAFVSLHVQVIGLLGDEGVLPLAPRLARARFEDAPSLFFLLGASDAVLHAVAVLGEIASLALAVGALPGLAALLAWAAYLSFVSVGWPFFPLQWDTLLCEALVLVAAASPWDRVLVRPSALPEPSPVARFALVFLVCRLHFASGLVKLLSGDPRWADLSALSYHFETQPLPNPIAPYVHALPATVLAAATLLTLVLEIGAPLLAPLRPARPLVVASLVGLQALIALTGNYGFFNVLSAALCIPLLDDAQLRVPAGVGREASPPSSPWARARVVVLATLVALATIDLVGSLGVVLPAPVERAAASVSPLHLTSSYGLFAVMTTVRDEIVLEGSEDGEQWVAYDFRYKPDAPEGGLPFAPLHLPRLDWMLWFAALGEPEDAGWVRALELALLEDRGPVRALFARVPFDHPPAYVRAVRYRYRYARGGRVWSREGAQPFGPVLHRRASARP